MMVSTIREEYFKVVGKPLGITRFYVMNSFPSAAIIFVQSIAVRSDILCFVFQFKNYKKLGQQITFSKNFKVSFVPFENLLPSMNNYRPFPLLSKNFLNIIEQESLIVFDARFKIFKLVFLTQTLPLAVYLTSNTKGTGSYGAPFFFFLFLSRTSSLSFSFSLCCSNCSSERGTSPIAPSNFERHSSELKPFFDKPRNQIVLLSSTKLLISSIMAGVSLFP